MISSLSTRLVAGVAVIAVTAVMAVALAARQGTRAAFIQFRASEISHEQHLARTQERLRTALDGRCCSSDALSEAVGLLTPPSGLIVIDAADRSVIATAGQAFANVTSVRVKEAGTGLALVVDRRGQLSGSRITVGIPYLAAPIRLADGRQAQVHAVRLPTSDELGRIADFYGSLDRGLLLATSLAGLVIVGLTWVMARRITSPLAQMSEASTAVARGDLARRVPEGGSDEIAALARSFNAMAAELQRQDALRRDLLNDVTHELRTPLTALRCRIESVVDGMSHDPGRDMRELLDEVRHLGRLVDDLEELSSVEARTLRLQLEQVPLRPVLDSALRAAGLQGDRRLTVDAGSELTVRADAVRLRQVLLNLLTNAQRYTPGHGVISITTHQRGGEVVIDVHNTGSTLDDEQRERVFDRFYRTDPARRRSTGGAGLGLAIARSLVEAQGARISVASTESEVTFSVAFPANRT
jgi:two-component system sensor histidine kinase BaeS